MSFKLKNTKFVLTFSKFVLFIGLGTKISDVDNLSLSNKILIKYQGSNFIALFNFSNLEVSTRYFTIRIFARLKHLFGTSHCVVESTGRMEPVCREPGKLYYSWINMVFHITQMQWQQQ